MDSTASRVASATSCRNALRSGEGVTSGMGAVTLNPERDAVVATHAAAEKQPLAA
jgi:hypothetical protein